MKKLFIMGLAAMGLALTACNSDETVEMAKGKAIGFSSFVDKSTRATDVTLANLDSMEVYGWRGDNQIFNAQKVTVDKNGVGTYSPLKYWEANYTYNFEAIAPKAGEKGVQFAAAKTGGTITFDNDAQTDLIYAKAKETTTLANITTTAPGKVNFTFKHQLARVKFTFKNTFPANAAAKISVKDVKITNAYKNGTITPAATEAKWNVTNVTNNTFEVSFANSATKAPTDLVATGVGETDHMYLIPTDKKESYEVTFTVTLDQNGVTTNYNHTVTIETTQSIGKSYNYVAEIGASNINPDSQLYPIEFTATVDSWVENWTDKTFDVK
ncbi:fimbrillin family protein [uncultured Prevotella sp.]|uniref:fimbrillin family protein n=1 Tax=uncultured Prevotella sp. TaxID=159272 RepID=UPI002666E2B6|nr:fimbrillin family protein [uncultured Prevotella sp.]